MKFGKSLSNQIEETLPEWGDKFLSYKELKKRLKLIDPKCEERSAASNNNSNNKRQRSLDDDEEDYTIVGDKEVIFAMTREEIDFINLLEAELEKFNWFFVDKEEEYIIRLKELQERVARANEAEDELIKVRKEIVDFHGEMVLLENYSALNYTGLVKILKKYEKRTGSLIRLPFIQRVLDQPFFGTDLLYQLVKECEMMLDHLFPTSDPSVPSKVDEDEKVSISSTAAKKDALLNGTKELAEIEDMESLYMKSTVSALRSLKEIRSKSSTVSVFSLPPVKDNYMEQT